MRIKWSAEIVKQWCEDNLGIPKESYGGSGLHWTFNEFLADDKKRKLYVNVDENNDRVGMWNGWKSGEDGDFIDLVAKFNNTGRKGAMRLIQSEYAKLLDPTKIVQVTEKSKDKQAKQEKQKPKIDMPEKLYNVSFSDDFSKKYIKYLQKRYMSKSFIEKCYYSYASKYQYKIMNEKGEHETKEMNINFSDYVIMPYRDRFDKIVYWTMRSVIPNVSLRYINCPGSDASNYIWNIETESEIAIVCEGIFDAESHAEGGIAPGGKEISDEQISQMLQRKFGKIIIGGNNEEYKKAPAKMIEVHKKLNREHKEVYIFDWPAFCKKHKISVNDFNQVAIMWNRKLQVSDIVPFLIKNRNEAEIKYRVNDTYPDE